VNFVELAFRVLQTVLRLKNESSPLSMLPNESENLFRFVKLSRQDELNNNFHAILPNNNIKHYFQLLTLSAFVVLIVLAVAQPFGGYSQFTGDFGE
jgi:hypothetical protein